MNDAALRRLVGIPYKFRGNGETEMDCWQLVVRAARELFGREYPAYPVALLKDVPAIVRTHLAEWREVSEPEPGDVVILSHQLMHCGIVLDQGRFLHTLEGRDSAVERLDSMMWRDRIETFRRYV